MLDLALECNQHTLFKTQLTLRRRRRMRYKKHDVLR